MVIAVLLAGLAVGCSDGESGDGGFAPVQQKQDLFQAVDPRIGTGGIGFGVGSTYPGPALPFAMIHPSPDTRTEKGVTSFYHCSGYYADDTILRAFSLLHFEGTGVPDYGTVGIMPTLGMSADKRDEPGHMQAFDKASEETKLGYYGVTLADGIRTEITSAARAALFRFTFPEGSDPVLLLDLNHRLEGDIPAADVTVAGQVFDAHVEHHGSMTGRIGGYHVYARGELDVAPTAFGTFDDGGLHEGQATVSGTPVGAWLEFPKGTAEVRLRVAVSFVDAQGAKKNLDAEAPDFDFDAMRAAAEDTWKTALGRVELYGANEYDTKVMATALYHALLMPTLMSDVDGRYVDAMGQVASGSGRRYNDFSLWDTYRTLHPWLLLTEDDHNADFAESLVSMAAEGGAVPVWGIAHGDSHTMIGSPGEIVLSESAQKGVVFSDEGAAYQLSRVAAYGPSPGPVGGRDGDLPDYISHGFVPSDVSNGSVSKTQEYAVADAALANWAQRLGIGADADELGQRGKSYAALYDSGMGFFRPKKADGSWDAMSDPTAMDDAFVEGNAWHYLWMVPHDPEGLAQTLGGKDAALDRLREFYQASLEDVPLVGVRKHYWPSNEPDINAPWLFAAWGEPGEGYRMIDWVVTELYGDGPDGIPGNDDGGTMSAWLLFAGAGLYPVSGTDQYILGMPRYQKMVLRRPGGDLEIQASPAPKLGLHPKRVLLDGEPVEGTTLRHADLAGAHVLRFELEAD